MCIIEMKMLSRSTRNLTKTVSSSMSLSSDVTNVLAEYSLCSYRSLPTDYNFIAVFIFLMHMYLKINCPVHNMRCMIIHCAKKKELVNNINAKGASPFHTSQRNDQLTAMNVELSALFIISALTRSLRVSVSQSCMKTR